MPRHSPSLCAYPPFPSGSSSVCVRGGKALLSPLTLTQCTTWLGARLLFFINFFVPQSLIWEKKKGDGPSCGKQPGCSACSMVLHFPGYLRIWLSMLSFTSSSYTWKVETMLSSLLGSRVFFPFKKPSEASKLAVLVHLVPWVQHPVRQPGRGPSVVKLHN